MPQPHRRPFLAEPDNALVLPTSPAALAHNYSAFLDVTGLTAADVVATPLVLIPLPQVNRAAGPRGWPATLNPAIAWHPLFWLPDRVAFRYRFDADEIESDQEWAVRVALEVSVSGLYDPTTGTWYDPLAAAGLNIEDPAVQNRVSAWLRGGVDELLSSIDLSDITEQDGDDAHWAVEAVTDLLPALVPASWARLADDLASEIGDLSLEATDALEASEVAAVIATLAISVLGPVPAVAGEQKPAELWAEIVEELETWDAGLDELIAGPIEQLTDSLYAIRDDYWPYVEEINQDLAAA